MKKLTVLFLIIVLSIALMGQTKLDNTSLGESKSHLLIRSLTKGKRTIQVSPTTNTTSFRSVSTVKQRLDSIVSHSFKENYSYDSNGRCTTVIEMEKDSAGAPFKTTGRTDTQYDNNGNCTQIVYCHWNYDYNKLMEEYKIIYAYNINNICTEKIYFTWDETMKSWIASSKQNYTFDSNELLTEELHYSWDNSGSNWKNSYKCTQQFDSNKNCIQKVEYNWNSTNNSWIGEYKYDYAYDSIGHKKEELFAIWKIDTWDVNTKDVYTYDSSGLCAENIGYRWFSDFPGLEDGFYNYNKAEYTYDSNGNCTWQIDYFWDHFTSSWIWAEVTENAFDMQNNNTQHIVWEWDNYLYKFVGLMRSDSNYDIDGNLVEEIDFNWDTNTEDFVKDNKVTYTYDNNYAFSDLLLPFQDASSSEIMNPFFRHKLLAMEGFGWDTISNTWVSHSGAPINFYYSTVNVQKLNNATLSPLKVYVYNGQVVLRDVTPGNSITIYTIQSIAIYSEQAKSDTIAIRLPAHGIYVVKVGNQSVKVIY